MKRLFVISLICLLLCGCGAPDAEETSIPTESESTLPAVDPTEPGGSYDPDSVIEAQTQGAVRAYPLSIPEAYAIMSMGSDVLVFSGSENTSITKLTGENLYVTASAQIGRRLESTDPDVLVNDKGVAYYDADTGEMVLLDVNLKEVSRISLPYDLVGSPVLSADRKNIYYCTADSVRVLTISSGISRMLREISYETQTVEAILFSDSILRIRLSDGTSEKSLFLSTQTGQTIVEYAGALTLTASGDNWYAVTDEGIMPAYLYGSADADARMLIPWNYTADGVWMEDLGSLVTFTAIAQSVGFQLDVYDGDSGTRTSRLYLEGSTAPVCLDCSASTGEILVLAAGPDDTLTLYRWDPAGTAMADNTVYSGPRYTLSAPDQDGLAACEALAMDMEARYGVDIRFGSEAAAVESPDYDLTAEYQVPVLMDALTALDEALAAYPEGFLPSVMTGISEDPIHICIVREITGSPESGSLDAVDGIQFWYGSSNYVALRVGCDTAGVLYRQMYYAMENCLMSNSNDLYDWEYLNPSGFDYDYDYTTYLTREDSMYLEGEKRYFIDAYSMTFPREDRAAIMQYAMSPGNEELFAGTYMQAKLKALCKAIREACGLTKSTDTYLWEQYLAKSLAYTPK